MYRLSHSIRHPAAKVKRKLLPVHVKENMPRVKKGIQKRQVNPTKIVLKRTEKTG